MQISSISGKEKMKHKKCRGVRNRMDIVKGERVRERERQIDQEREREREKERVCMCERENRKKTKREKAGTERQKIQKEEMRGKNLCKNPFYSTNVKSR